MTEQARSGVEAAERPAERGVRVDAYDVVFLAGAVALLLGVAAWLSPWASVALAGLIAMIGAVIAVIRSEG